MYPSKIMLFFLILERHVPIYYLTTVSLVRICFTFNEIETGQTDREREYSALIGRLELTNQSDQRALVSISLNVKQIRNKPSGLKILIKLPTILTYSYGKIFNCCIPNNNIMFLL